jgi:hypothetical protein
MLIICMPEMKLSYIWLECEYRKPMSLLYKLSYTNIVFAEKTILTLSLSNNGNSNRTGNRPGATQASKRNHHHSSSSHHCILSYVTTRVSRHMVSIEQVKEKT